MTLICIGMAIAIIVVEFTYKATENHTEWVFQKIKISGIKFNIICKLIALLMMVLFYLFCMIGLDDILPYGYVVFIYANIIILFLAPLKWEAEYCVRKREERVKYDDEGIAEACELLIVPCSEIYIVAMIYLKIMYGWSYESLFVDMEWFRMAMFFEIISIVLKIVTYRRFSNRR